MKKPLFNLEQREAIRLKTYIGAEMELKLAFMKCRREIYENEGCISGRKKVKQLLDHINKILFNR